ncbi:MAG TPA: T9SS type A sorting domain-containing protein [Rubricoccaceae bacterium]|jgi:hypothetical protein
MSLGMMRSDYGRTAPAGYPDSAHVTVVLDGAVGQGETAVGVETGAWPAGVYVVRVTTGAQTATTRLVVAR